jgi:uncharacterized protein related to proFAR isomerase
VSVRSGEVVVVRGAAYEPVEDAAGSPFAPDEFVDVFLKDYPAVLFFDIDGIDGKGAQFEALGTLDAVKPEVWWEGGARDHTDVVNVITAGADRAVVSTRTFAGLKELRRASELTENLALEIVTKGRDVLGGAREFRGKTPSALAREAAGAHVEKFILLDAARPLGGAIDWPLATGVAPHAKELLVGGGIEAAAARAMEPPQGVAVSGAVVDLISVLSPFL